MGNVLGKPEQSRMRTLMGAENKENRVTGWSDRFHLLLVLLRQTWTMLVWRTKRTVRRIWSYGRIRSFPLNSLF